MTMHPFRPASARWVVLALVLLLSAACSGAATPESASSPTSASSSATGVTPIQATFNGAGTHPTVTVEAQSPPWTLFKGYALTRDTEGGGFLGVSFWDVGEVARDPCHSLGHLYDPGPTVDDLVAALEAQSMRHATAPTDVTLAGYQGKYLEWSVPADSVVTGDGDFAGCDVQSDGHRNFVSWIGAGGVGERWQQIAGQVDRLWVLDVDGQRLVVDATYSPDTTQAQRDEEDRVVQSVQFVAST
jgi:hypothetical protein